jgi:hypothetical protein
VIFNEINVVIVWGQNFSGKLFAKIHYTYLAAMSGNSATKAPETDMDVASFEEESGAGVEASCCRLERF